MNNSAVSTDSRRPYLEAVGRAYRQYSTRGYSGRHVRRRRGFCAGDRCIRLLSRANGRNWRGTRPKGCSVCPTRSRAMGRTRKTTQGVSDARAGGSASPRRQPSGSSARWRYEPFQPAEVCVLMITFALLPHSLTLCPPRGRLGRGARVRCQLPTAGPCSGRPCSPAFSIETL